MYIWIKKLEEDKYEINKIMIWSLEDLKTLFSDEIITCLYNVELNQAKHFRINVDIEDIIRD